MKIAATSQNLNSSIENIACFEALCGVRNVALLTEKIPSICTTNEADYVDTNSNWFKATNWAAMLCKALADVDPGVWDECPTTRNEVERRNQDCSLPNPQHPKLAVMEA